MSGEIILSRIINDWLLSHKFRVPFTIDYASSDCFFIRSTKHNQLIGFMHGETLFIDVDGLCVRLMPEDPKFFINIKKYINNWKCRK